MRASAVEKQVHWGCGSHLGVIASANKNLRRKRIKSLVPGADSRPLSLTACGKENHIVSRGLNE